MLNDVAYRAPLSRSILYMGLSASGAFSFTTRYTVVNILDFVSPEYFSYSERESSD